MRLIDGGRLLIDYCKANCGKIPDNEEVCPNCYAAQMIANAPTIDPESLLEKGEWIDDKDDVYWHNHFIHKHCSLCAVEAIYDYSRSRYILTDFCPNCGAKMDGERR